MPAEASRPTPVEIPYRAIREIGSGGMARVFEAEARADGSRVALKVLRGRYHGVGEVESRFRYEADLMRRLEHPGVPRVFALGAIPGGGLYCAMTLVEGKSLEASFALRGSHLLDPPPVDRTLRIVARTAAALQHAHDRGIVHRDLKPGNILLDELDQPSLIDWGMAKRIDAPEVEQGIQATLPGVVKGTPAYMAPEQTRGKPELVGFSADLFALGVILYELLTGELPFKGQTAREVMGAILEETPTRPRLVRPRIPKAVEAVCLKALAKSEAERYPSAQALAEDLTRCRRGERPTAYEPGFLRRLLNRLFP